LVARKDLTVEWRSRVTVQQLVPLAALVLVVFGFALDANPTVLEQTAPGLFWVAVLFAALLAVQRCMSIESVDGLADALRLTGLSMAGIFLGKAFGVLVQLLLLEAVLLAGVVLLFDVGVELAWVLVASAAVASAAISASGVLYGVLLLGVRTRETLLPLLLVPVLAPVLLAASRAFETALGVTADGAWNWVGFLLVVAAVYLAAGMTAFGTLMEDG
jgi:heme exporter protein B